MNYTIEQFKSISYAHPLSYEKEQQLFLIEQKYGKNTIINEKLDYFISKYDKNFIWDDYDIKNFYENKTSKHSIDHELEWRINYKAFDEEIKIIRHATFDYFTIIGNYYYVGFGQIPLANRMQNKNIYINFLPNKGIMPLDCEFAISDRVKKKSYSNINRYVIKVFK